MGSLERVQALLEAARAVARDPAIAFAIGRTTGLSRAGVELGLTRYLETDASPSDLSGLVRTTGSTSHVHVILSANVFTAPLRALAVACAAAEQVTVQPSRRDPVFATALVRAVNSASLRIATDSDVGLLREGEVDVYGRDETVSAVRRALPPGVVLRAHGAGFGVALVGPSVDLGSAAAAIAEDVIVFDQRGCLSPRAVFVVGDVVRAETFAERLSARLAELGTSVPRGRLAEDEGRLAARYVETMAFAGRVLEGPAHVVGIAAHGGAFLLPPAGRHVHVVRVGEVSEARQALAPLRRFLVALGCDDDADGARLCSGAQSVRISRLGRMQKPPLDGPVDLRAASGPPSTSPE